MRNRDEIRKGYEKDEDMVGHLIDNVQHRRVCSAGETGYADGSLCRFQW